MALLETASWHFFAGVFEMLANIVGNLGDTLFGLAQFFFAAEFILKIVPPRPEFAGRSGRAIQGFILANGKQQLTVSKQFRDFIVALIAQMLTNAFRRRIP